jgi:alpha-beta hydrolase superfamily lysophospholipase
MNKVLFLFVCLLLANECMALKPKKTYDVIPDTIGVAFEKNIIVTSDNFKLNSWTILPGKKSRNNIVLVLAYADAGNMSWWLGQAATLANAGFTVVLFDYRGFGKSDPFKIDPKMLYYTEFATDLSAALQFARKKYPGRKTGIWAFSMGTVIATLASHLTKPDFIIGEGYVTDPIKIQSFYAKKNDHILLPENAKDYERSLAEINVPMLIFSGKKDEVTTLDEVEKLKKNKPAIKVISFEGGHMEGFYALSKDYQGSVYVNYMKTFLHIQ